MEPTSGVSLTASSTDEAIILAQKEDEELISWTREATLLLIEEYKVRQSKIDNGRLSKKKAFEQIADELRLKGYAFSQEQCGSRMKTIYRAYKNVKDANAKSGRERKTYIFEKELDELYKDKPNITPKFVESTASTTSTADEDQQDDELEQNVETLKRKPNSPPEEKGIKRARKSQVCEVLSFIESQSVEHEKRREQNEIRKQKRHEEKVDLFKQFLSIMEKK